MFLRLFKRNTPVDYPVLLIYTFLLNGILFFKHNLSIIQQPSIFNYFIDFDFQKLIPHTYLVLISITGVFIASIAFTRYINKIGIFSTKSLLPAYIFVTLTGIFPAMVMISPSLIAFWLMLYIAFDILKIFDMENVVQKLFFISFLLGLVSFIYFPVGYYLIFVIIALPILKTPKLRELLIIPVGYSIPFYLVGLYFYFNGQLMNFITIIRQNFYLPKVEIPQNFDISLTFIIYPLLLIIVSYLNFKFQSANILVRYIRYFNVLFLYFIVTLLIILIIPVNKYLSGFYIIIPVAIYLTNFFNNTSLPKTKEILLILLLLLIIASQINFYYT